MASILKSLAALQAPLDSCQSSRTGLAVLFTASLRLPDGKINIQGRQQTPEVGVHDLKPIKVGKNECCAGQRLLFYALYKAA